MAIPACALLSWYTSLTHAGIGRDALALGGPLLLFGCSAPVQAGATHWIVDERDQPISMRQLGALAQISSQVAVRRAFGELVRAGTLRVRDDGAVGFAMATWRSYQTEDPVMETDAKRTAPMSDAERAARYRVRNPKRTRRDARRDAASRFVTPNVTPAVTLRDAKRDAARDAAPAFSSRVAPAEVSDLTLESGEIQSQRERERESPPLPPQAGPLVQSPEQSPEVARIRGMLERGTGGRPPPHALSEKTSRRVLRPRTAYLADRLADGWSFDSLADLVYGVAEAISAGAWDLRSLPWSEGMFEGGRIGRYDDALAAWRSRVDTARAELDDAPSPLARVQPDHAQVLAMMAETELFAPLAARMQAEAPRLHAVPGAG